MLWCKRLSSWIHGSTVSLETEDLHCLKGSHCITQVNQAVQHALIPFSHKKSMQGGLSTSRMYVRNRKDGMPPSCTRVALLSIKHTNSAAACDEIACQVTLHDFQHQVALGRGLLLRAMLQSHADAFQVELPTAFPRRTQTC